MDIVTENDVTMGIGIDSDIVIGMNMDVYNDTDTNIYEDI